MGKTFEKQNITTSQTAKATALESNAMVPAIPRTSAAAFQSSGPPMALVDPLFQDLDLRSRRYLSYFSVQYCHEIALNVNAEQNIYRQLLQYIGNQPLLRDMIIAVSAYSMFQHLPHDTDRSTFYRDALVSKQNALSTLMSKIGDVSVADINIALASVLLFVQFELMDSGKDTWRAHVEGAKMLVYHLQKRRSGHDGSNPSVVSLVNVRLISECIV
jgi:hypothetical protein